MLSHDEIADELMAMEQGKPRSWWQIGFILDQVDLSEYWKEDHSGSNSFSEWLNKFSEELFHVKPAMLWRHISATRYMADLRKRSKIWMPQVDDLPPQLGSESVELLSKLERVLPEDDFVRLLKSFTKSEVSRSELRSTWLLYRPMLDGQTARGRGTIPPKVSAKDKVKRREQIKAGVLRILKRSCKDWIAEYPLKKTTAFTHVTLEGADTVFPAVGASKTATGTVRYHGFLFFDDLIEKNVEAFEKYTDYLWVILGAGEDENESHADRQIPGRIGILRATDSTVTPLRQPELNPGTERLTLASTILSKAIF